MKDKFYIGNKLVKSIKVLDRKTPLGDDIIELNFGEKERKVSTSRMKFNLIKTSESSDATVARKTLVEDLGRKIYGMLVEFGVSVEEVNPILDNVANLAKNAVEKSDNILWGVEGEYQVDLLMINEVLMRDFQRDVEGENNDN